MLLNYMKSFDASSIAAPTPVKEMKKVILTGATGFVGRHFIALLLDGPDTMIETVLCR